MHELGHFWWGFATQVSLDTATRKSTQPKQVFWLINAFLQQPSGNRREIHYGQLTISRIRGFPFLALSLRKHKVMSIEEVQDLKDYPKHPRKWHGDSLIIFFCISILFYSLSICACRDWGMGKVVLVHATVRGFPACLGSKVFGT